METLCSIIPFDENDEVGKREFVNIYLGSSIYDALVFAKGNGLIEDVYPLDAYVHDEDGTVNDEHVTEICRAFGISPDDFERLRKEN